MTDTLREPTAVDHPAADTSAAHERPWGKEPPVDRRGFAGWVLAYVVMTALAIGVGSLLVHELGGVRSLDDRVARWFSRHRTSAWDDVTWFGSFIADAYVKIPVTIVLCVFFLWRWRRWTEPTLLAGALVLEVGVFSTTAFAIDRPRPPI